MVILLSTSIHRTYFLRNKVSFFQYYDVIKYGRCEQIWLFMIDLTTLDHIWSHHNTQRMIPYPLITTLLTHPSYPPFATGTVKSTIPRTACTVVKTGSRCTMINFWKNVPFSHVICKWHCGTNKKLQMYQILNLRTQSLNYKFYY